MWMRPALFITACCLAASLMPAPLHSSPVQQHYVIGTILLEGNRVTRDKIILRELTFASGDTVAAGDLDDRLKRSRENLLNTSLFNYVTIDTAGGQGTLGVTVKVEERWYTWPLPIFELADRNFNVWWETRDFSRTNYGFHIVRYNFRGRKETVKVRIRLGYSEQYQLSYAVPYLSRKQNSGLTWSFGLSRNHEISYGARDNEHLYFEDDIRYVRHILSTDLVYAYRQGYYNTHTAMVRFVDNRVADTIAALSSDYLTTGSTHSSYLSAAYWFRRDRRDFRPYPLSGYYADIEVMKIGLGFGGRDEPDILFAAGSLKKYWKLGARTFLSGSFHARLSDNSRQPYSIMRGLGYGSQYVRSYELKVVDGTSYWLAKSGFKYALLPPKVKTFSFIPSDKFNKISYALYINLFADAGYVVDRHLYLDNPLNNHVLTGIGAGLDFVTYYDKVLRVEYSVNREGKGGVFLHFVAPI